MHKRHPIHRAVSLLSIGLSLFSSFLPAEELPAVLKAGDEYRGIHLFETELSSEGLIDNKVTVRESRVINHPEPGMLGYNHNWLWNNRYMSLVKDGKIELNSEYIDEVEGIPFPLNRLAGMDSQRFRWKGAIGELAGRQPQRLVDWTAPEVLTTGPVEWLKMMRRLDPSFQAAWVINMVEDSSLDNADFVEFLTGDGKSNPNGGPNWAKMRIELGIAEPMIPELIELGNEMDWGDERQHFPVDVYIEQCRARMAAMRAVHPELKFAAHAATAPWSPKHEETGGWRNWHQKVLRELGEEIDFIVIHPYYHGIPVSVIEGQYMKVLMEDIVAVTGSDRIKIFVSEHARWPGSMKKEDRFQTHSLEGLLATAEWVNRMLQYPEVKYMAYHCLSGGPWGVVYQRDDWSFYRTAMAQFFEVYHEALGAEVVASIVEGKGANPAERDLRLTVNTMTSGDGLRVVVVNREPEAARRMAFEFEGQWMLRRKVVITGSHMDAVNDGHKQEVHVEDESVPSSAAPFEGCTVPARSMSVLYLDPLPLTTM